jgi:hypothetical protein
MGSLHLWTVESVWGSSYHIRGLAITWKYSGSPIVYAERDGKFSPSLICPPVIVSSHCHSTGKGQCMWPTASCGLHCTCIHRLLRRVWCVAQSHDRVVRLPPAVYARTSLHFHVVSCGDNRQLECPLQYQPSPDRGSLHSCNLIYTSGIAHCLRQDDFV